MQQDKVKIGILSHYYHSMNYGGNLQAYALCRFLQTHFPGVQAEQVSYDIRKNAKRPRRQTKLSVGRVLRKVRTVLQNKLYAKTKAEENRAIRLRERAILEFNTKSISHSAEVYDAANIAQCVPQYDVFITGSDQVWHPNAVCPAYLLSFVDGAKKPKLSYAASISKTELDNEQIQMFREALQDYEAVSVREADAVRLLSGVSPTVPVQVLDPTMLLTVAEWKTVATPRKNEDPYLFCYFLGDDARQRQLVADFAKEKGLEIVTLPYLLGKYRKCDAKFGDTRLFDVSVPDFLSLIEFADYVCTDSFHAVVFSLLFEKEFFAFERTGAKGAGTRVHSLLSLYNLEERFCSTPDAMQTSYLAGLSPVDYAKQFEKVEDCRAFSVRFLEAALRGVKDSGRPDPTSVAANKD